MRILIVTETLAIGGAESFCVRLANALAVDHEVTIAVLHGEIVNPALVARISEGVAVERLMLPAKRWLFRGDSLLRQMGVDRSPLRAIQRRWLSRIARRFGPTIIHSHLLKADMAAAEVCSDNRGVRHVITLHGDYAPFLSGQSDPQMLGIRRRVASVIGRADGIAAICREQLDFVAREFPAATARTRMIYNGYVPWRRKPGGTVSIDDALTFGMVSRGVERKGWGKAIAAFAILPPGAARLVLVGDGPAIDRLRLETVPEGVEFAGFSADPVEWIEGFDVGLLPSEFPH
ncbi:MAG: glycosyltransferase, partial [Sphingomicrobium sp.]